jgi:hypothetical protein
VSAEAKKAVELSLQAVLCSAISSRASVLRVFVESEILYALPAGKGQARRFQHDFWTAI